MNILHRRLLIDEPKVDGGGGGVYAGNAIEE